MNISKKARDVVRNKYGGRCAYCGCSLGDVFHVDHIVPKSAGGRNVVENYNPSCQECNRSKGCKTIEAWRAWLAIDNVVGMPQFSLEQINWLRDSYGVDILEEERTGWYFEYEGWV